MGCDIHIHVERKVKNNWVSIDLYEKNEYFCNDGDSDEPEYSRLEVYDSRSYLLFGALAGVRMEGVPHTPAKGFPKNASKECADDFLEWGMDAHTPSYLTLQELKEQQLTDLITDGLHPFNELIANIEQFLKYRYHTTPWKNKDLSDDTIRIVFWFDN